MRKCCISVSLQPAVNQSQYTILRGPCWGMTMCRIRVCVPWWTLVLHQCTASLWHSFLFSLRTSVQHFRVKLARSCSWIQFSIGLETYGTSSCQIQHQTFCMAIVSMVTSAQKKALAMMLREFLLIPMQRWGSVPSWLAKILLFCFPFVNRSWISDHVFPWQNYCVFQDYKLSSTLG